MLWSGWILADKWWSIGLHHIIDQNNILDEAR